MAVSARAENKEQANYEDPKLTAWVTRSSSLPSLFFLDTNLHKKVTKIQIGRRILHEDKDHFLYKLANNRNCKQSNIYCIKSSTATSQAVTL